MLVTPVMRIECLQQAADHRVGRPAIRIDTQGEHDRGWDVVDPFGDRRAGAVAGHNGADRRGH
jgi:hypothetical protein